MNKKKIINIIYSIVLILVLIIGYFYVKTVNVENDIELPILDVELNGSSILISAKDNVTISTYTYNNLNEIPSDWYEANNKKEFNKTLKIVTTGTYFFWVKDSNGNISEAKQIVLNCLSGTYDEITNDIYCPYSSVNFNGYRWHVLKDESGYITLFMDSNQLNSLNHCDSLLTSEYCYYIDEENYDSYSWNKSIINNYLNNEFINIFNKNVIFKEESICSDRSGQDGCIDNDGCAGYLSNEINEYGFICHNQFVSSKIRLLTYIEYNNILLDLKDENKSWLYGEGKFWTMMGFNKPVYAGSINEKGIFIVDENSNTELDIRPVITIKK